MVNLLLEKGRKRQQLCMKNMLKLLLLSSSKRERDKIIEQTFANAQFGQDLSFTSVSVETRPSTSLSSLQMRKLGFEYLEHINPGVLGEKLRSAFHQSRREFALG
jgi:hypothetical protein